MPTAIYNNNKRTNKENEMKTYRITKEEQEELKRANMNDLIRDMLGTLLKLGSK